MATTKKISELTSLTSASANTIFVAVDSGSTYKVTLGTIENSLSIPFSKNRTTPTSIDIVKQYQSIFNPSNLLIGENDIFIVEQNAEYYVLGDLTNNGTISVTGSVLVGGALYNYGAIVGSGSIL